MRLWLDIQNRPRHLGQHSGGMVIAAGRLDEVVPLEPASMPGRVVVQWDKDDCADMGMVKVDLLGLGMLAALEEAIPMIRTNEKVEVDLAHLPPDDPAIYEMQIEAIFRALRAARNHGLRGRDDCGAWSYNARLDTIQAAEYPRAPRACRRGRRGS
mgnify:CR=1 FL=1